MKKLLFLPIIICFINTAMAQYQLEVLCELPETLEEISGMTFDKAQNIVWAVNDSGNDASLVGYDLSTQQVITKAYLVDGYNTDWEDLATGADGTIYIADTGNNNYKREDFFVHWVNPIRDDKNTSVKGLKTTIKFPEAYTKKDRIRMDIEAMVVVDDAFYFFTKTTKKDGFDGFTEVFKAAAVPGVVHAKKVGQITLCKSRSDCKITGATYNHNTKTLALISHKNLWVLPDFLTNLTIVDTQIQRYEFLIDSQKESLTFLTDNVLLISEEKNYGQHNLYRFQLHLE